VTEKDIEYCKICYTVLRKLRNLAKSPAAVIRNRSNSNEYNNNNNNYSTNYDVGDYDNE
jgi:hypothetical protein